MRRQRVDPAPDQVVPDSHDEMYLRCSSESLSISMPIASSLSLATSASI